MAVAAKKRNSGASGNDVTALAQISEHLHRYFANDRLFLP